MSTVMEPLPAVKFSPRRIAHANLFVGKYEETQRFYRDVCGLAEIVVEPRGAAFMGNGAGHHEIALIEAKAAEVVGPDGHVQIPGRDLPPGLNHIAFQMDSEEDLIQAWERGVGMGLHVDHLTDHGVAHSVYLRTPDGVAVEIYADITDDWRTMFNKPGDASRMVDWQPRSTPPFTKSSYHEDHEVLRVDDALLHTVGFSHAGLTVDDLDRTIEFFTDVIGLEVTRRPEPGRVQLALTGPRMAGSRQDIALMQRIGDEPKLHHLAFQLESGTSPDEMVASLEGAGIEIEQRLPNGVFIHDPEGNRLELFAPG